LRENFLGGFWISEFIINKRFIMELFTENKVAPSSDDEEWISTGHQSRGGGGRGGRGGRGRGGRGGRGGRNNFDAASRKRLTHFINFPFYLTENDLTKGLDAFRLKVLEMDPS
jgi:hypothetical protein